MLKRIALLLIVCLLAGMALAEEVVSPEAEAPVADVELELAGEAEAGETLVAAAAEGEFELAGEAGKAGEAEADIAAPEWNVAEEATPKAAPEFDVRYGSYKDDDGKLVEYGELVAYNGKGGDVVIPEGVTEIYANGIFDDNITTLVFPTTMHTVMDSVFEGQSKLTKVVFQSRVFLGEFAFSDCNKLKTVVLPEGFTGIGYSNFSGCSSLKTLKLPSTLKRIDSGAFSDSGISDITLNEGLEYINDGAFSHCNGLKEITLPASLEGVYSGAFENCSNLKTVTILNPKTSLEGGVFEAWNDDAQEMEPSCAEGFTLRGWPGSTAEAYAKEWGYNFEPLVAVSKVKLDKTGEQSLKLGKTLTLKATLSPADANVGTEVTWKSSDKKIATVSKKGVVTPVAKGTVKITAKAGGKSKSITVKVSAPKPTKLVLYKTSVKTKNKLKNKQTVTLKKGKTLKLMTKLTPKYAETTFTWKSSDKKVATVSKSGRVKAVAKGNATITCKTKNGLSFKVKIKVK